MLALLCMWIGISVPLVFVGYYFGYRKYVSSVIWLNVTFVIHQRQKNSVLLLSMPKLIKPAVDFQRIKACGINTHAPFCIWQPLYA